MSFEKENLDRPENAEAVKKSAEAGFDREEEKEKRKEIRKMLVSSLSETLKESGFKKEDYSVWRKSADGRTEIIYLQRSSFAHQYYIEMGIREPAEKEGFVRVDITDCQTRDRIEGVMAEAIDKQYANKEEAEAVKEEKLKEIQEALDFEKRRDSEIAGSKKQEENEEEYYFPSVSLPEAQAKIAKIKEAVEKYAVPWFSSQEK